MQELILGCDAFISDYSSCIFDAAIREIPCFTYANDFQEYKGDRGVYYEMEELPFAYAKNNDELINNIQRFDYDDYIKKWNEFKIRTGLYETGHASKDIAYVIGEFVKGNKNPFEEIKSEE
jgi:CDP-glycerol glycerophosphotransferase